MTNEELFKQTRTLYAPKDYGNQPCRYHDAPMSMVTEYTGGCGPGGLGDYLVPDTAWGLCIKPSCSIHDWMYAFGTKQGDKDLADIIFLENMITQIRAASRWLRMPRLYRATTYYIAVSEGGERAFWHGKA